MAVVVIGGLVSSKLLTLVLVSTLDTMRRLFRRRGFAALLTALAAAAPLAPTLGPSLSPAEVQARNTAAPATALWFKFLNWHSQLFLTVSAPADTNGSPIVQRSNLTASQSQPWMLTNGATGNQYLRSGATSSWRALGISASSRTDGGRP